MKTKNILLAFLISLFFSSGAYAINAPVVRDIPAKVNANYFTLTIYTELGAKIAVTGGPAQVAPVTDGEGLDDEEDGTVEVKVKLAQETVNTFSIIAEKNGEFSDSVIVTINETSEGTPPGTGDITPPEAPVLNPIPDFVSSKEYIITGTAEPYANIYARIPLGEALGSTQADASGNFQFLVPLKENQTNRFNISAEDEAGNEGPATQAIIRMSVDLVEPPEEETLDLDTSAQIFFNDVEGHWAESYIESLYLDEVISGKSEGIFDPDGQITRAELTKIAILAFGYSVNIAVEEHPFSDVPKTAWFAPYVEEAKRTGIVQGYPSGGFGPNDYITRAATLKILLEAAEIDTAGLTPDFPDVPIDAWFAPYVAYAQQNGVVSGYDDGYFHPERNVTRAQVAKMVVKILELVNSDQ